MLEYIELRKISFITIFLLIISQIVHSNSNVVSGLYNMPRHSVKFESAKDFSLLPIGWSENGHMALLIYQSNRIIENKKGSLQLLIFDLVEDQYIWDSGYYSCSTMNEISSIWEENLDLFSEKLSHLGIIPEENPQYGGTVLSIFKDQYKFFHEIPSLVNSASIESLDLLIQSERLGKKILYKYVENNLAHKVLKNFKVLGHFLSPWEKRVAIFSKEEFLSSTGSIESDLRISGAHLTLGFKIEISSKNLLIDAILSGQVYNSRRLLKEGADPQIKTSTGESLTILSAMRGNWEILFLLLEYGADPFVKDRRQMTLLHYAALDGDTVVIKYLISLGLDAKAVNHDGNSPYSLALSENNIEASIILNF